jgi:geranylgeranyl pyrophosphate synthase
MASISWHYPLSAVEDFLEETLRSPDKGTQPALSRLRRAMRSSVFSGGKRLRSQLVLETFHAASRYCGHDGDLRHVLPAAAAIELIHAYSLVHDDLPAMDDAATRRGRPSCHVEYGEATAILVGDALLTLAFDVMGNTPEDHKGALQATRILARAAGEAGMVGGQMIDIAWSNEMERDGDFNSLHIGGDDLLAMHALKTGALFRAACAMGAVLGSENDPAGDKLQTALGDYGAHLGRAFQLKDDLLDVEGDPSVTGKSATDADNDKITAPALFGLEATKNLALQAHDAALEALEPFGEEARALRELAQFTIQREK